MHGIKMLVAVLLFIPVTPVLATETPGETAEQSSSLTFQAVETNDLSPVEKAFVNEARTKKGLYHLGSLWVIALGPMPHSGYGIALERQYPQGKKVTLYIKQTQPEQGMQYPQAIVYPYIAGKLAPSAALSVVDAASGEELFDEKAMEATAKKKQFIIGEKTSLTVKLPKNMTSADLKNIRIFVKDFGTGTLNYPVKVSQDSKRKNTLKVTPLQPYQAGVTYTLFIEDTAAKTQTIIPYEMKKAGHAVQVNDDFQSGLRGWQGDFADLPVDFDSASYLLQFGHSAIPLRQEAPKKGLLLSGINRSDDLFMYAKKKLGGPGILLPNTTYSVEITLDFYTNVDPGLFGIGGAPGESVYVKAGASSVEPKKVSASGYWRMNIDKGEQSSSGASAAVIGNVAKIAASGEDYKQKTVKTVQPLQATTNNQGELWVFFGTDSGFEGQTTLYYSNVKMKLVKKPDLR